MASSSSAAAAAPPPPLRMAVSPQTPKQSLSHRVFVSKSDFSTLLEGEDKSTSDTTKLWRMGRRSAPLLLVIIEGKLVFNVSYPQQYCFVPLLAAALVVAAVVYLYMCACSILIAGNVHDFFRFVPPPNFNISKMTLQVEMSQDKRVKDVKAPLLQIAFKKTFSMKVVHVDEKFSIKFKGAQILLTLMEARCGHRSVDQGLLTHDSEIYFEILEGNVKIIDQIYDQDKLFRRRIHVNILEEQLTSLGIGGMTSTFMNLFEKAFATRTLPSDVSKRLSINHVKGVLLYGPPGTGKTLISRKIAALLNARGPWVVRGPEVYAKYLGESEEKMRELFKPALDDQKKYGNMSPLHIIIIDEIDSVARKRGLCVEDGNDRVLNQFLSLIDGFDHLNNIFLIGTTNRPDIIDGALLRPGRLELNLEISFPDEQGREQILKVHSRNIQKEGILQLDFDFKQLASMTENWSGADLESLVRQALSSAIVRASNGFQCFEEEKLRITEKDFLDCFYHIQNMKERGGA
ncbi:vesicle-fusing ATPase-like [Malania oleifera]|uniref:vesicle-fusing ATPase-like n=1 Tax=Malania oleifera TaxID=397392 RepID=UPI0025AEAC6A|nr:vesicle-fusing ATPase-like [Malania oleifera]